MIPNYFYHINQIKQRLLPILQDDLKETLEQICTNIEDYFSKLYNLFPVFHAYKENPLLNHYNINKDFFEKDSLELQSLMSLLDAAKCDIQDVKDACISHPHDGTGMDAKRKIESGIRNIIEVGFNEFYQQENQVDLVVDIKRNRISIYVRTLGPTISFSERSEGLRWYLNMYIDILANDLENKRVVYLIDEPGVYLHVDAQKKVLELFDE